MEKGLVEIYSPEWWHERQGSFTGSQIYRLMTEPRSKAAKEAGELSEGATTYILEKVWEALSGQVVQGVNNMATEYGNENEPLAKKHYTTITGNEVSEAFLAHKEYIKGFTGSPDGLVGNDGMIEVKCPWNGANHLKHCFITTDEYFKSEHPDYYWQIQSYLLLTDRKWCDFVSFDGRIDSKLGMFIYRLSADMKAQDLLIEKVTKARELFEGYLHSFKSNN
jgi:hypothetical protein